MRTLQDTAVGYRDGVQDAEMTLWTPAWPVAPTVEGCPLLFNGHVDAPG